MRDRDKILSNLEDMYREAYDRASRDDDEAEMTELDLRFQRDQLFLEALLDIRALLSVSQKPDEEAREESLLDKAERLRRITRLR